MSATFRILAGGSVRAPHIDGNGLAEGLRGRTAPKRPDLDPPCRNAHLQRPTRDGIYVPMRRYRSGCWRRRRLRVKSVYLEIQKKNRGWNAGKESPAG